MHAQAATARGEGALDEVTLEQRAEGASDEHPSLVLRQLFLFHAFLLVVFAPALVHSVTGKIPLNGPLRASAAARFLLSDGSVAAVLGAEFEQLARRAAAVAGGEDSGDLREEGSGNRHIFGEQVEEEENPQHQRPAFALNHAQRPFGACSTRPTCSKGFIFNG